MAILKFYFPSNNGDDQDAFMEHLWKQGTMSYLIFVRRMSLRGNPYVKGVFACDDTMTPPPEFECSLLEGDCVSCVISDIQEELSVENNGMELGSLQIN